ncbi:unnamed protein product, partial [Mycena citricolor]
MPAKLPMDEGLAHMSSLTPNAKCDRHRHHSRDPSCSSGAERDTPPDGVEWPAYEWSTHLSAAVDNGLVPAREETISLQQPCCEHSLK